MTTYLSVLCDEIIPAHAELWQAIGDWSSWCQRVEGWNADEEQPERRREREDRLREPCRRLVKAARDVDELLRLRYDSAPDAWPEPVRQHLQAMRDFLVDELLPHLADDPWECIATLPHFGALRSAGSALARRFAGLGHWLHEAANDPECRARLLEPVADDLPEGGTYHPAAWYSKATDGDLYPDLLGKAGRAGIVTMRKVGHRNHFDLESVIRYAPDHEAALRSAHDRNANRREPART